MQSINEHIQKSQGYRNQALAPMTQKFWRQEQISQEQFFEMADTFDILLFKTNCAGAKIIRTYSNSEWDHAAMVLKFGSQPNKVFYLEATGDVGVSI